MAKKQDKIKAQSPLKTIGKYSALVVISWIICCYLLYAFVSSIGIPFLSSPRPAVPFSMASVICLMLWVADGFVGVQVWGLRWYKVFITIVLSIIIFAVLLIGPSEYKEYQKRQLPQRAAEHANAVVLHDGIQRIEESNDIVYISFLVPFEVTQKIKSLELPYLFEFVSVSDGYQFSPKEQCNEEFIQSLITRNEKIYSSKSNTGPLLKNLEFLHFPELQNNKDKKTYDYVLTNVFQHQIPVYDYDKKIDLQPGTVYFIYKSFGIKSANCTAKDFVNEKVTTPFIHVKK
jgi:hypothetical protein